MRNTCTFLDIYNTCIRARLEKIDVFLRAEEEPYALADVAELLAIDPLALLAMLQDTPPDAIDRAAFLRILHGGESYICRLFRREEERIAPLVYTREDIAYIYGLAPEAVNHACDALGIREATALLLPQIFACIPLAAAMGCV